MIDELRQLCNTYRKLHDYFQDKEDRVEPDNYSTTSLEDIEYIIDYYHKKYNIADLCSNVQVYGTINDIKNFVIDVNRELAFYIFMKDYLLDKVKYSQLFNKLYEKKRNEAYNITMQSHQPDITDYDWPDVKAELDRSQSKLPRYYSRAGKANKFKAKT